MKVIFWVIVSIFLAGLMMVSGVYHLLNPEFYVPIVPSYIPFPLAIVYLSGIIELLLGIVTLFLNQKYTKYGLFGIFVLMVIFLPLHISDALKDQPVIGSHTVANIRLFFQFVLIWLSWKSYQFTSLARIESR
ncbi:hypothetical protein IV494_05865 [Kaistella sp. G5-32]|uniref:DoxX-like protein n=1 Tax=Kaistella gelatinilytica TaxID=2787636 RepID=A0ABS0FAM6_9FLAO|nr:hypothetical protein [Kaistella gelatinilytica]MBF8456705.1 hypothetical protein [Kaistella gelatinilytica]